MGIACQKLLQVSASRSGQPESKSDRSPRAFCYRCQSNKSQDILKYSSRPSVLAVNTDPGTDHGCEGAARAGVVRAVIYEGAGWTIAPGLNEGCDAQVAQAAEFVSS
jgi:hypothetical protein